MMLRWKTLDTYGVLYEMMNGHRSKKILFASCVSLVVTTGLSLLSWVFLLVAPALIFLLVCWMPGYLHRHSIYCGTGSRHNIDRWYARDAYEYLPKNLQEQLGGDEEFYFHLRTMTQDEVGVLNKGLNDIRSMEGQRQKALKALLGPNASELESKQRWDDLMERVETAKRDIKLDTEVYKQMGDEECS